MEIRSLNDSDFERLCDLIYEVYSDYPLALLFEKKPGQQELLNIFSAKMDGIKGNIVIDMVADEDGTLVGECEIVKRSASTAVVGVIIRNGYRKKGLGADLLNRSISMAEEIGIEWLVAEVDERNSFALEFFEKAGFVIKGSRMRDSFKISVFEKELNGSR